MLKLGYGAFINAISYGNPVTYYRKDTEPLYYFFMCLLVSLHSGIYPLPAIHSLLVTLYVTEFIFVQGVPSQILQI